MLTFGDVLLTLTQARALRTLEFLYDAPGRSSSVETTIEPLAIEMGDPQHVQDTIDQLLASQLVFTEAGVAGYSGAILLPAGEQEVERIRGAREDHLMRNQTVRDALLRWLYDEEVRTGHNTYLNLFTTSKYGQFYGQPFTDDEITRASQWLKDNGLIGGTAAWGAGIVRPQITSTGMSMIEREQSVNSSTEPGAPSFNLHVGGSLAGNVMVNSPGARQDYEVANEAVEAATSVVNAVREVIDALGLSAEQHAKLTQLLDDTSKDAQRKSPSALRDLLARIKTVVVSGSGTAIGTLLVAQIGNVIGMLPGS